MLGTRRDSIEQHCCPCYNRADLVEVEPAQGHPKLAVYGFCDDEIESSFPDLLWNFDQAVKESSTDRFHQEHGGGKCEGFAPVPTSDTVGVAINDEDNKQKEDDPDAILKDLRNEVGAEFEFALERTGEKPLVYAPVARHGFRLPLRREAYTCDDAGTLPNRSPRVAQHQTRREVDQAIFPTS